MILPKPKTTNRRTFNHFIFSHHHHFTQANQCVCEQQCDLHLDTDDDDDDLELIDDEEEERDDDEEGYLDLFDLCLLFGEVDSLDDLS